MRSKWLWWTRKDKMLVLIHYASFSEYNTITKEIWSFYLKINIIKFRLVCLITCNTFVRVNFTYPFCSLKCMKYVWHISLKRKQNYPFLIHKFIKTLLNKNKTTFATHELHRGVSFTGIWPYTRRCTSLYKHYKQTDVNFFGYFLLGLTSLISCCFWISAL